MLLIVSSALSALALAYVIYQLSFNPEKEAERHRAAAKELWLIRERYLALLTDFAELSDEVIRRRRDELTADLKWLPVRPRYDIEGLQGGAGGPQAK